MAKPIVRPKQHSIKDVYAIYVTKLLDAHPTWWGKYEKRVKRKNCYICAKENGKVIIKMSWFIWKDVIEVYFHKAKNAIIQGETLRLGANLGKIRGARIQRDFTKPVINWRETFNGEKGPDGKFIRVFRTEDDYCRIEWNKFGIIPNETNYHFKPAGRNMTTKKGFTAEFSKALTEDPLLKYQYKYYPIVKRINKFPIPCNTNIPVFGTSLEP